MSLIKSISGIRGTIGGATGDTLNPLDIVKFTTAYATFIRKSTPNGSNKIVVGREDDHFASIHDGSWPGGGILRATTASCLISLSS